MKLTEYVLLTVLVTVMFVLAACMQRVICPDGTYVKDASECAAVETAGQAADDAATMLDDLNDQANDALVDAEATPASTTLDPKIQALVDKASKVKSYSFLHAKITMTQTGPVTYAENTYYRFGDKVKVERALPKHYDSDTWVDTVYLNLASKSAQGYCMSNHQVECSVEGEERTVSFSDFDITYPKELLDEIPSDAYIKETKQYQNREVKVIRWNEGNTYYELYLDPFYGMPLRYAWYANSDFTDLQGGFEYQDMAYNLVKEGDVVHG